MNLISAIFIIALISFILMSSCCFCKSNVVESLDTTSCPDILVMENGKMVLYNSDLPGTPVKTFETMDEYVEHAEKNTECPVLYLQEESTKQGTEINRRKPTPFDLLPTNTNLPKAQAVAPTAELLDATRDRGPYNNTGYAGFDAHGQHIGEVTKIDAIHKSTGLQTLSRNPMDSNWGGIPYTQAAVDTGVYKDREVAKPKFFQPRGKFIKGVFTAHGGPGDYY